MGMRKTRTQRAQIAALLARLRTKYCTAQCVLASGTSFFSSLLVRGRGFYISIDRASREETQLSRPIGNDLGGTAVDDDGVFDADPPTVREVDPGLDRNHHAGLQD